MAHYSLNEFESHDSLLYTTEVEHFPDIRRSKFLPRIITSRGLMCVPCWVSSVLLPFKA